MEIIRNWCISVLVIMLAALFAACMGFEDLVIFCVVSLILVTLWFVIAIFDNQKGFIMEHDISYMLTAMAFNSLTERFSNDEHTIDYFNDMTKILVNEFKEAKDGEEMEAAIKEMLLHVFCSGYMIGDNECTKAWIKIRDDD